MGEIHISWNRRNQWGWRSRKYFQTFDVGRPGRNVQQHKGTRIALNLICSLFSTNWTHHFIHRLPIPEYGPVGDTGSRQRAHFSQSGHTAHVKFVPVVSHILKALHRNTVRQNLHEMSSDFICTLVLSVSDGPDKPWFVWWKIALLYSADKQSIGDPAFVPPLRPDSGPIRRSKRLPQLQTSAIPLILFTKAQTMNLVLLHRSICRVPFEHSSWVWRDGQP